MATHNTYHVTICLTVTDARALRETAARLATALGIARWHFTRRSTEDDLIMLLDPGPLPGVQIIETLVDCPSEMAASPPTQPELQISRRTRSLLSESSHQKISLVTDFLPACTTLPARDDRPQWFTYSAPSSVRSMTGRRSLL